MKDKYLNDLRKELDKRAYESTDNVVAYFDEVISDRLEDGESLKAILEELGDPENVARDLTNNAPTFDDSFANHQEFVGLTGMHLELIAYDVHIEKSPDDRVIIDYDSDDNRHLDISYTRNKLSIEEVKSGSSILQAVFGGRKQGDSGIIYKLNIMVPDTYLKRCHIENVSGDIRIDFLNTTSFHSESVSGNTEIEDLTAHEIHIESVSGDIYLDNCRCDKLHSESISGIFRGSDVEVNDGHLESVTGSISLMLHGSREDYAIRKSTLASNIQDNKFAEKRVKFESVSGRINYTFTRSR